MQSTKRSKQVFMKKNPVAVVLGGIVPHIPLICDLKERGYYTVVVDYYENPPAAQYADEHIRESTLNQKKVLEIAQAYHAGLVTGLCVDQANVTFCYVSEKLNLPMPYSYETALDVTDKSRMKKIMKRAKIPTSAFIVTDCEEHIDWETLQFPLVVKPVDNNGSKGVKKVVSARQLKEAVSYAISISRAKKAIVEEFNDGQEIQIDCFVKDHKAHVIMMKKRLKIAGRQGDAMQAFGSIVPAGISKGAERNIQKIADEIVQAFHLNNTPFFIQAIVSGEAVSVLEFAPRIGGTTSFVMIKMATGFDILKTSLAVLLGDDQSIVYHKPDRYTSTIIFYAYHGIFKCVENYKEIMRKNMVEEFYVTAMEGMEFGRDMDSRNRVGSFIVTADTKEDLIEKAHAVLDMIKVCDIVGNDIMRRDLYPSIDML